MSRVVSSCVSTEAEAGGSVIGAGNVPRIHMPAQWTLVVFLSWMSLSYQQSWFLGEVFLHRIYAHVFQ